MGIRQNLFLNLWLIPGNNFHTYSNKKTSCERREDSEKGYAVWLYFMEKKP